MKIEKKIVMKWYIILSRWVWIGFHLIVDDYNVVSNLNHSENIPNTKLNPNHE